MEAEVRVLEADIVALKLLWEELLAPAESNAGALYVAVVRSCGSAESLSGVPHLPEDISEGLNVGGNANL